MFKSQILTERQQLELNKAIIQYLEPILSENDHQTLAKLSETLKIPINSKDESSNIVSNYLEKKWSTVLRLQRKIIDLENEVSNLRTVIDSQQALGPVNGGSSVISKDKINWLPSSTSKVFSTQLNQMIQTNTIHPHLPVVLAGCSDGSIIVWSLVNDESSIPDKIIKAHTRGVNKLVWSRDPVDLSTGPSNIINSTLASSSYLLASCSSDLSIKIWNGSSYKHIRTLTGHEHTISSIKFSHIKPTILYSVSRDKTVKIWDLVNGYCIKSFIGHSEWVRDIDVISINSKLLLGQIKQSDMGDFILTCSNDQSARLSHADSGTGLALLIGHNHVIEAIKFLPLTSNIIIDKYLKDNITLFPSISQEVISDPVYSETLGYKYCITASRDNTIKLWLLPPPILVPHRHPLPAKVNNSQAWLIADLIGHQSWVKGVSIHPNGRFIFSGGDDKTIKIWDLESLNVGGKVRCIRTLSGHDGFINDLEFASFKIDQLEAKDDKDKVKSEEETHGEILKAIEKRMRCLFVSGGADNTMRFWG
ncbi:nuclear distribution protein PAC1 [Suhomyces tanzawaensis NRRL Y-17324]|uniref:Nuclear distribution protein PAC1 n=1 Tax=Suhomyces tanzawaensis NRRL Y-17324 TaxID=984487 RepID=A0A1E4SQ02_9ASCO|nr:nuclear distribution protein PAC1 [Suhomyces tanzawaensis NRRL Y-17324]ODV81492.1 nuclear distribution protein PAC1 [Suhomyces tanzawaensis NRRL Y-17324]